MFILLPENLSDLMSATFPAGNEIILEEMVSRYGAIIMKAPLSKMDFVELAKQHPDLLMEPEKTV